MDVYLLFLWPSCLCGGGAGFLLKLLRLSSDFWNWLFCLNVSLCTTCILGAYGGLAIGSPVTEVPGGCEAKFWVLEIEPSVLDE